MDSLQPGIKHLEFWVKDLEVSLNFYQPLFFLIGWAQYANNGFRAIGSGTKIYFVQENVTRIDTIGPRHVCFRAMSREVVNKVKDYLLTTQAKIIRGPMESEYNSKKSYHVDFKDTDGYIIEVSYTNLDTTTK
jgi:catechol 2,3-dioxygenase-like lactoylglutathione lyase family enzyme